LMIYRSWPYGVVLSPLKQEVPQYVKNCWHPHPSTIYLFLVSRNILWLDHDHTRWSHTPETRSAIISQKPLRSPHQNHTCPSKLISSITCFLRQGLVDQGHFGKFKVTQHIQEKSNFNTSSYNRQWYLHEIFRNVQSVTGLNISKTIGISHP
jgi:hypothetical protein